MMMAGTVACAAIWIFPYLENFKSVRPFSQEVKRIVPSAMPLYVYADTMNDFNYYLEREVVPVVRSGAEVENLLTQPHGSYILIKNKDLNKLKKIPRRRVIATESLGSTTWNLIALQP
jgi:hypothetical protein